MIDAYFAQIEQVLQAVPNTQNLTLRKTLGISTWMPAKP
jgi:hypothetical protein